MEIWGSKGVVLLVALAQGCAIHACYAAPPLSSGTQAAMSKPATSQNIAQNAVHFSPERLDLRAPAHVVTEDKAASFPSATIHRQFGDQEQTAQLPSLGGGNPHIRPPLVELARHIQHEGLPVARLWENNSALVHIGLNTRGKPGLWLVQKVH